MLKLAEFRKEKGLTQKELADMLEMNFKKLGAWEQLRAEPNIADIILLADYFGCTTDELLGREVAEPAPNNSIKITPLARRLLEAFDKMDEEDQRKFVGMAEALAVMS